MRIDLERLVFPMEVLGGATREAAGPVKQAPIDDAPAGAQVDVEADEEEPIELAEHPPVSVRACVVSRKFNKDLLHLQVSCYALNGRDADPGHNT